MLCDNCGSPDVFVRALVHATDVFTGESREVNRYECRRCGHLFIPLRVNGQESDWRGQEALRRKTQ